MLRLPDNGLRKEIEALAQFLPNVGDNALHLLEELDIAGNPLEREQLTKIFLTRSWNDFFLTLTIF